MYGEGVNWEEKYTYLTPKHDQPTVYEDH